MVGIKDVAMESIDGARLPQFLAGTNRTDSRRGGIAAMDAGKGQSTPIYRIGYAGDDCKGVCALSTPPMQALESMADTGRELASFHRGRFVGRGDGGLRVPVEFYHL